LVIKTSTTLVTKMNTTTNTMKASGIADRAGVHSTVCAMATVALVADVFVECRGSGLVVRPHRRER